MRMAELGPTPWESQGPMLSPHLSCSLRIVEFIEPRARWGNSSLGAVVLLSRMESSVLHCSTATGSPIRREGLGLVSSEALFSCVFLLTY